MHREDWLSQLVATGPVIVGYFTAVEVEVGMNASIIS